MTKQLCAEITLYHGDHSVTLRASLKAAFALARTSRGFPMLLARIDGWRHATLCLIFRACATDWREADRGLHALGDQPLHGFISEAQTAAYQLIAGVLPGATGDTDTPAKAD